MPHLVVVAGPIASGKSTVADALGARLRQDGRPVAVIDLDEVVMTIGGFADLSETRHGQAWVVFGRLAAAWLEQGFDVVAHGSFLSGEAIDALRHGLRDGVELRRVLLHTTYEVALGRVRGAPDRGMSQDPDFLRGTYDRWEALRDQQPPSEWVFDTAATGWEAIVEQLHAALSG